MSRRKRPIRSQEVDWYGVVICDDGLKIPGRAGYAAAARAINRRDARSAHHEAGHAVAASLLGHPVERVTIVLDSDAKTAGTVHFKVPLREVWFSLADAISCDDAEARKAAEQTVVVLFAGPIAEREWARQTSKSERGRYFGADRDFESAADILLQLGGSDEKHATLYKRLLWRRAEWFVTLRWQYVMDVALALIERRTLTAEDLESVLCETTENNRRELAAKLLTPRVRSKTAGSMAI